MLFGLPECDLSFVWGGEENTTNEKGYKRSELSRGMDRGEIRNVATRLATRWQLIVDTRWQKPVVWQPIDIEW